MLDDTHLEGLTREFSNPMRYRVLRELAAGGMGRVFEAEQLGADGFVKRVALKVIHRRLADPTFTAMFVGEARLVADLIHPNIVQIYQLDKLEDTYYIAMELIEGMNLCEFLELHQALDERCPPDLATFIISRVARGLEYAHCKRGSDGNLLNVVHRDVSPRNIMINSEGEVKLADFGLAKAVHYLESQEDGEQVFGKIEYMAPEQAAGQETTAQCDIYALGLVYYEILAGFQPMRYASLSFSELLTRVATANYPPIDTTLPDLPASMAAILSRCLQRDPNSRYASSASLCHDLETAIYSSGYGPTIVKLAGYVKALLQRSARPSAP